MQKQMAMVTGASSGIGREMAVLLSRRGYDLILVARRKDRLEEVQKEVERGGRTHCEIAQADLSKEQDCFDLYEDHRHKNITILINCAGFGAYGSFGEIPLEKELQMIDVNITALHILTKLFLKDFKSRNKGHILNVSSAAGLMPGGPYMAAYYASKAYVTSLTMGLAQELEDEKSNVYIGALCPGPVDTEFNEVAEVTFGLKGITAAECATYGIKEMFKRKTIIIPGNVMKVSSWSSKLIPRQWVVAIAGRQQKKKRGTWTN